MENLEKFMLSDHQCYVSNFKSTFRNGDVYELLSEVSGDSVQKKGFKVRTLKDILQKLSISSDKVLYWDYDGACQVFLYGVPSLVKDTVDSLNEKNIISSPFNQDFVRTHDDVIQKDTAVYNDILEKCFDSSGSKSYDISILNIVSQPNKVIKRQTLQKPKKQTQPRKETVAKTTAPRRNPKKTAVSQVSQTE